MMITISLGYHGDMMGLDIISNNLWPGTYGNSLRIIKWLIVDFKDPEL